MKELMCLVCQRELPDDLSKVIAHMELKHPELPCNEPRKARAVKNVEMRFKDEIIYPEDRNNGTAKEIN